MGSLLAVHDPRLVWWDPPRLARTGRPSSCLG